MNKEKINKYKIRALFVGVILLALLIYFSRGYLNLEYLKSQLDALQDYYQNNSLKLALIYFFTYVFVTTFPIPAASALTLIGAAVFGFWPCLIMVSFASSIGGSSSMLLSRYILRDWVQGKFTKQLNAMDKGLRRDGESYLFSLRLLPIFPFFIVNLLFGLSRISVKRFYLISQLGMLPATAIYVNAGAQLGGLESARDIFSWEILLSLGLLAAFPHIAKIIYKKYKIKQRYRSFRLPQKFEYDLVVVGAGAAGLSCAYIARMLKAKVALVEANKMGGDCLNYGCVPSKALIKAAKLAHQSRSSQKHGVDCQVAVDFPRVMSRVREAIAEISPHDSSVRYRGLGVTCLEGEARLQSPWEVEVGGKIHRSRNICIATGAAPYHPQLDGLDQVEFFDTESIWRLEQAPRRLLVLGGGPAGCELAQAFQRLGVQTVIVEKGEHLLPREDADFADLIKLQLQTEGVEVHLNTEAVKVQDGKLFCKFKGQELSLEFDKLLLALGRRPRTANLGLDEIGLEVDDRGYVAVNSKLQSVFPNIYACGDVVGQYQLTNAAGYQAWYCAVNALLPFSVRQNLRGLPWVIYTDPEFACAGFNEKAAEKSGLPYEVVTYSLADNDRVIIDGSYAGKMKVIISKGRVLGVNIVSSHAAEILANWSQIVRCRGKLGKVLHNMHPYPSFTEANHALAGKWRAQQISPNILKLLEGYHRWRRS